MPGKLADQVAIVTGGNSGIGEATVHLFAQEGAKVAILARRENEGHAVESAVKDNGGEATFVRCDVSDRQQVDAAVQAVVDAYGGVDVLFNNAGGGGPGNFPDEPDDIWNRVLTVNLTGTFYMCRAVWPHMIAGGGGRIVNMSSVAAQRGFSKKMYDLVGRGPSASYYAAKAGVDALTRYVAGMGGSAQHPRERREARADHHTCGRHRRRAPQPRGDVRLHPDPRQQGIPRGCRQHRAVPRERGGQVHHRRDSQRGRRGSFMPGKPVVGGVT